MQLLLIGIDDTDNLDSRGTGYRARCLTEALQANDFGTVTGVTRHQLLVDDAIPYTSHNSSACIRLESGNGGSVTAVIDFCRTFLLEDAAEGSDVGLCVAALEAAARVQAYGRRAQKEVLQRTEAEALAASLQICLEGLTGDHGGKIGALAAVGLHSAGDDGRYIWVRGIRDLEEQTLSRDDLARMTGIERVCTVAGMEIDDPAQKIYLGSWPRPVRDAGRATLLVEKHHGENAHWKVLDKQAIKAFRI